ncbi:MAG: hypothetical protein ACPGUE_21515 [Marinomonas sp.]|uniref:hypothetical protein n=1 Tax=unclassified Marinomonas TaxID=196814 RepID=UPI0007AF80B0|nr:MULTISPECIES: hypothetical protein [unclassified Marinomonas]KZM40092.1 hypothetical protein OA92_18730 [Marinomonas sp. SBI22]KZM41386.1 hypothetical protein OA91_17965 [Marinomonas sp. SBI8L]
MKLSDFNQISNHPQKIKPSSPAWDIAFVCAIFIIASSSFFYDSYQEANPNPSLKSAQLNLK